MKLGILGAADIAFRRFLPALKKCPDITYAGVASRTPEKAARFVEAYGGNGYSSYEALIADKSIDAVYVPLPPALHYEWGKKVLESGKHLLMEKPFTASLRETETLLALAEEKHLAVYENYMFLYHSQLQKIKAMLADRTFGELRLFRMSFGFPKRAEGDFRYNKALGGGALLDCGGYPVRLALELLGDTTRVMQAKLSQPEGYEVDLYGSAVLENKDGLCAQISFGMDNSYKCELEIWGSRASLFTDRIFTAPPTCQPVLYCKRQDTIQKVRLDADDAFFKSICVFQIACTEERFKCMRRREIKQQNILTDQIRRGGKQI